MGFMAVHCDKRECDYDVPIEFIATSTTVALSPIRFSHSNAQSGLGYRLRVYA